MAREEFHDKPYDDGTLTKLRIFQLYVQEWIPVFLSKPNPPFDELHIFDFFSGPGTDSNNVPGSPLRILDVLRSYQQRKLAGWSRVKKVIHFFDVNPSKIQQLKYLVASRNLEISGVDFDIQTMEFSKALGDFSQVLSNRRAAKLLIIDQFGVDAVSDTVFRDLISLPTTDFLFFLSTSTLHRFRDHPAIKQKIAHPEDSYHVHRAAFEYYKKMLPADGKVFLGQFSIRKRSNIYGLVFGSLHPLGIHKFLQVAWRTDEIAGEANFDVDREKIHPDQMVFALDEMKPKKIQVFEENLTLLFKSKSFIHEIDVLHYCIESGMTAQHTTSVIARLKHEGLFSCDFRVPDPGRIRQPRSIAYS